MHPQRSMSCLAFVAAMTLMACAQATPDPAPAPAAATRADTAVDADDPAAPPVANARAFLESLDADARADTALPFDDPARTEWTYVPRTRVGLSLGSMNPAQRTAAFALLGTALSPRGTELARGIVDLELTLRGIERAAWNPMALRRDPDLYHLATFGTPDAEIPWGWRFEGHHLSVNVTHAGPDAQIVAPLFMGANPARVPDGPNAGHRLLAAEQDLAFELLAMLDARQLAQAVIAGRTFGDIVTGDDPAVAPMAFAGLPASDMTPVQQRQLRRLLELYASRMTAAAAAAQLQRIDAAGFARLHFAWAGAREPRAPHYYRVHGPTVLVEFDNSQGDANHIHTVWRDLENDFGGDLLRRHRAAHGGGGGHSHD